MIDLDQARTFVAIVEAGNFRDAAELLGIAQPTASLRLTKLETTLGHKLVERRRERARTTIHGARFLPYARTLLRVAERAIGALDRRGLVIGASSNIGVYLLQPIIHAFQAAHPAIALDLRIGTNLETIKRLEDNEVDVALMEWWDDRAGFHAAVWRQEDIVVIVPPDHAWAQRKAIDKAALLDEPLIGGEPGTGTARLLQQALEIDGDVLKVRLQLGSTEAVKRAVRAGLGVSVTLASAVHDEVCSGLLHALRIRGVALTKPLYIIIPELLLNNDEARAFDVFLRQRHARPKPGRHRSKPS